MASLHFEECKLACFSGYSDPQHSGLRKIHHIHWVAGRPTGMTTYWQVTDTVMTDGSAFKCKCYIFSVTQVYDQYIKSCTEDSEGFMSKRVKV